MDVVVIIVDDMVAIVVDDDWGVLRFIGNVDCEGVVVGSSLLSLKTKQELKHLVG